MKKDLDEDLEDTEMTTKRSNKKKTSSHKKKKGKKGKKEKEKKEKKSKSKKSEELNELEESYVNREDIEECISHLEAYYDSLNKIDLDEIITKENIKYLQEMNPAENVQIDLLLIKIYAKIFASEDFYNNYFSDEEENEEKIPLVIDLIEEPIKVIDNFSDYFISLEIFQLKENLIKLIKFMYINLKEDIIDEDKSHFSQLVTELPTRFFSENYLELIKLKNTIYRNNNELLKNIEDIDNLFFELGSYYEQLSCIKLLFNDLEIDENLESKNNYSSVSVKDIKKKRKKSKKVNSEEEDGKTSSSKKEKVEYTVDDLIIYGQFLLKICIYQKFHLKDENIEKKKKKKRKGRKEESEEEEEEEVEEEEEENEEIEEEEEEEDEKNKKKKKNKKNDKDDKKNKKSKDKNDKNNKNKKKKKKEEEEEEEEEEESEEEDDPKNVLSLFIIDAVKKVKGKIQDKSNENIEMEEILDNKICLSLHERDNLFEIIKKNIDNFNNLTKKTKNKTIKTLKEKLSLYISAINEDKYIPINLEHINNIKYYNNFSKNTVKVPNRDTRIFYIENAEDKKGLLFVEFYLTEENKDIIFRINRYDPAEDDFKEIYDSGKLGKKLKLGIYFEEQALYQIEFDNKYSWINSKEVNFTFSLFRISDEDPNKIKAKKKEKNEINNEINNNENNIDNNNENNNINKDNIEENEDNKKENEEKKEEKIEEKKVEDEDEENAVKNKDILQSKIRDAILKNTKVIKFYCNYEDQNYTFNCNKIYKKINAYEELVKNNLIQDNTIKISILVNLNKIRIITFDNNDKIIYNEIIDEKEKLITKQFFNNTISNYLNENYKIENNNNKILINLYSQNKNLALVSNKVKELMNALKDYSINNIDKTQNKIYSQFLQKLGFYPDKKIGEYEIIYNLYDFSDQCLIYHLYLAHCHTKFVGSSTLVMIFDKDCLHITALNEGGIYSKFKSLENTWKHKYYSKLKMDDFKSISEFITALSDSFDGLDLVLCYMNNEEKKDDLLDLFNQIKEFTAKKIDEQINVYIYNEEDLIRKMLKYIGLFSEE